MLCARTQTCRDLKKTCFVYEEFKAKFMNRIKCGYFPRYKMHQTVDYLSTVVDTAISKGFGGAVPTRPVLVTRPIQDPNPSSSTRPVTDDDDDDEDYKFRKGPLTESERIALTTYVENILQNILNPRYLFSEFYVARKVQVLSKIARIPVSDRVLDLSKKMKTVPKSKRNLTS